MTTYEEYERAVAEEHRQWARIRELADMMAEECPWCWKGDRPENEQIIYEVVEAFRRRGMMRPYSSPSKPKRKSISTTKSLKVFARDEYRCVRCGTRENLTVDHIHPVSKGGSNAMDNLQTLCGSCNSRKGAKIIGNDKAGAGS